jgi:hypothetical protein
MKKLILTLTIVAMGTVAYAQSTANDDITASATILAPVAVTAGANLAFGDVAQGSTATIAYNNASAGTFSVTGNASTSVELALTLPATLSGGGDPLTITYTAGYDVASEANEDPTSGTAFATSAQTAQTVTLNASGQAFVSVGGSISPTSAHTGTYTGTITLTASYN